MRGYYLSQEKDKYFDNLLLKLKPPIKVKKTLKMYIKARYKRQ